MSFKLLREATQRTVNRDRRAVALEPPDIIKECPVLRGLVLRDGKLADHHPDGDKPKSD